MILGMVWQKVACFYPTKQGLKGFGNSQGRRSLIPLRALYWSTLHFLPSLAIFIFPVFKGPHWLSLCTDPPSGKNRRRGFSNVSWGEGEFVHRLINTGCKLQSPFRLLALVALVLHMVPASLFLTAFDWWLHAVPDPDLEIRRGAVIQTLR